MKLHRVFPAERVPGSQNFAELEPTAERVGGLVAEEPYRHLDSLPVQRLALAVTPPFVQHHRELSVYQAFPLV